MLDIDTTRAVSLAAHLPLKEPRLSTSEHSTSQNPQLVPRLTLTEQLRNPWPVPGLTLTEQDLIGHQVPGLPLTDLVTWSGLLRQPIRHSTRALQKYLVSVV